MAKTKISEYDSNPSNNTDLDSINLSEGVMTPSSLNDAHRMQMAHLKDFSDGTSGIDVLNLQDDDGSASIKIQAPATVTTTTTFTLPDGDGSAGQVLDTDGSGTLAWTKVQASNLDVTGNGTAGQSLTSDGDGSFTWANVAGYPQVITVLSSGNYTIPSGATAVMIRASGAGGSGAIASIRDNNDGYSSNGNDGGDTTVTNATLSIAVTAKGGKGGTYSSTSTQSQQTGSTGGDVVSCGGASGGAGRGFLRNSLNGHFPADGLNGDMVVKYVTGASVGGKILTISYGSGGAAKSGNDGIGTYYSAKGQSGFVEIWVW